MSGRLLLPLAVIILASLILAGCRPPPLMSYPWFWDYTKTEPKAEDLAGTYKISKLRLRSDLSNQVRLQEATITLAADHTADLSNFPEFDAGGQQLVCRLLGSANWQLDEGFTGTGSWSVIFRNYRPAAKPTVKECELEKSIWGGILILGRTAPYRLYAIVGDPDSDTGVEFGKAAAGVSKLHVSRIFNDQDSEARGPHFSF